MFTSYSIIGCVIIRNKYNAYRSVFRQALLFNYYFLFIDYIDALFQSFEGIFFVNICLK